MQNIGGGLTVWDVGSFIEFSFSGENVFWFLWERTDEISISNFAVTPSFFAEKCGAEEINEFAFPSEKEKLFWFFKNL